MKFIFAPDSFKGSLTAMEICSLLSEAALRHFPHAEIQSVPVADGGEGTVDALLLATQGQKAQVKVSGPLGENVSADYGILGDGETMDGQSVRFGKVPAGIAARCARAGVPLLAIVGGMEKGAEELFDMAEASIITTVGGVMTLETALSNANELFKSAADRAFRLLKIGFEMKV